jgi:hypothetical protein
LLKDAQFEMRKRLVYPRQAQDEPLGKVLFTFLGGLACDLEGVGAVARHRLCTTLRTYYIFSMLLCHKKDFCSRIV